MSYSIFITLLTGTLGAVVGAVITHRFNILRIKKQRANELINEFYSKEFIEHRISVWKTKNRILNNEVSVKFIIIGYIYPLDSTCYEGDEIYGYSEHQHLTLYFGYLERLSNALIYKEADSKVIKKALEYEFLWNNDLFANLCLCAETIFEEKKSDEIDMPKPYFIDSINNIEAILNINKKTKKEINPKKHFEFKEHEKDKVKKKNNE